MEINEELKTAWEFVENTSTSVLQKTWLLWLRQELPPLMQAESLYTLSFKYRYHLIFQAYGIKQSLTFQKRKYVLSGPLTFW